jgi:molybdate transport system ATP-binding protein
VSAFVADFTGAVVLHGQARPGPAGLTLVALDGGGEITSTDAASGAVAASVFPWEITLAPGDEAHGSARNALSAQVTSVTTIGNRVRVGLLAPQPLVAEVTDPGADAVHLAPGARVTAVWKAAATRLIPG